MDPVEIALDALRQAMIAFHALLEREATALRENRTDELALVVTDKTHWSNLANTAWNRLVVAAGIDTRRGDTLDGIMLANPVLRAPWLEVRQIAEKAERLNLSNNTMIEAQLMRTRQALDVLQSAANRGSLYNASGRMVDGLQSGHTLDKV